MKANLHRAIAVLAFCVAAVPPLFAQNTWTHPRIISVTGNAEVKVAPDEATLTLGVDSHDRDLAAAKTDNDKRIKKLLNLAHTAGVETKNIQTSALTMGPEYSDEKIPKLLGFRVSPTVALKLTDLSKYEELMTEALKAGVNGVDGINFFVSHAKNYREEARLKAVQAAREKATAMAAQLGQSIGKPWEVTERADVDENEVILGLPYKMPQQEATVAGGEVTIRAVVRISFLLE